MRQGRRIIQGAVCALLLTGSLGLAGAQTLRGVRVDLHPIKFQVGVVTRVTGKTAWVKLPQRVAEGRDIEFVPYSDGGDVLAKGRVHWVAPTAPYEAYVTGIETVSTSHSISELEDRFSVALIGNVRRDYGPLPDSNGFGSYLAVGFFARALPEPPRENAEAVEPVRAHIAALRARNTATARSIASAAERALVKDPILPDGEEEEPVNFSLLSDNLRRFRRVRIEDPVTEKLLKRLFTLTEYYGSISEKVPTDFLRPIEDTLGTQGGLQGGLGR